MASAKSATNGANANGVAAEAAGPNPTGAPKPHRAASAAQSEARDAPRENPKKAPERSPLNSIRPSRPRARSAREDGPERNGVRSDGNGATRSRAQPAKPRPTKS